MFINYLDFILKIVSLNIFFLFLGNLNLFILVLTINYFIFKYTRYYQMIVYPIKFYYFSIVIKNFNILFILNECFLLITK